ncbi:hypothetical protein ACO0LD_09710 [Undibacterium sp. Ji83W]
MLITVVPQAKCEMAYIETTRVMQPAGQVNATTVACGKKTGGKTRLYSPI